MTRRQINYTSDDPNTPIGDTWVDKGTPSGTIDAIEFLRIAVGLLT
ncbi:MAG: hypothetical protein IPJ39_21175 [Saprospiraceae bacterium]|nr:hypothetical protein [Saprospiraceae bacterium]